MDKNIVEIFCDGGSRGNPGPAASASVIMIDGKVVETLSKYLGKTTNNIAEYSAVLLSFEWLLKNKDQIGNREIKFILDSELVVRQLTGKYKVKKEHLKIFKEKISEYEKEFSKISYNHVLRHKNKIADRLVNETLDRI